MQPTVLLLAVTLALAGPKVEQRLKSAQTALNELDYEVAAQELTVALSDPNITPEQRLRANLMAGIANRVIGHDVDARMNFVYVFQHDPDAKLPAGTPPKITTFFDLVRNEVLGESETLALKQDGGATRDPLATKRLTGKAAFTIATNPPGASVFVDSRRLGTAPLTVNDVSPGTTRVSIARSGDKLVQFEVPLYDAEQTIVSVTYEDKKPSDADVAFHYGWVAGKTTACAALGATGGACIAMATPSLVNFTSSNYANNAVCVSVLCAAPGAVLLVSGLGFGTWAVFDLLDPPHGDSLGHVAIQSPREEAPTRFTVTERADETMAH